MTDDELSTRLKDRKALVVHLSHHAIMRAEGVFPDDLKKAIANTTIWALSCVVVWPGHRMRLPGSIGIILEPKAANVLSASGEDTGSHQLDSGVDQSAGPGLSSDSFDDTFRVRGDYNEWRVRGAGVVGIFVEGRYGLQAKKLRHLHDEHGNVFLENQIYAVDVLFEEVAAAFPTLPILTMTPDGPVELRHA